MSDKEKEVECGTCGEWHEPEKIVECECLDDVCPDCRDTFHKDCALDEI